MSDHPALSAHEIRQRYLAFFAARGHAVIPSASLVPENDPTVLFTTAGMQPLVPYLLGAQHPQGNRLVSVQKCVRTGDIEEVGDNRHLTFFEMLGNWSLNDYFKDQSIEWSLEFLTNKEEGLGLDPHRLYVTVFEGEEGIPLDEESIGIWKREFAKHGIEAKDAREASVADGARIFLMGRDDNWWGPAGQTGPCGPDTEIFYDVVGGDLPVDTQGNLDWESGRVVEIWNNVFMQYTKELDGSYVRTPHHNVDTGMGLERIAMIMQGKANPFETDLFASLIEALPSFTDERAWYIAADHFRTAVMMVADGVLPSNKDRGYILRRLIRRATLHVAQTGTEWIKPVVDAVGKIYQDQYPLISQAHDEIAQAISEEVAKFQRTLEKGKQEIAKRQAITGKDAFDLYQSYGFPLELTKEYAESRGIHVDQAEFESEFKKHQDLSRTASAGQFSSGLADHSDQTVKYHTATHLLHQALRNILGPHVQQKGSNLNPERLRFDFTHPEKMTPEQISAVEVEVNAQIQADHQVSVDTMSPDKAKEEGAIGLFGHKYGDSVTVYSIGSYSKEICTGPHVTHTNDMGHFKIVKEEAVSAGVRRIKAVLE
jgi:alanyl-tRNA synthetase